MKEIALLIPVHNKLTYTSQCVEKLDNVLFNSNLINIRIKIIVIDDGSTDGTSEWLSQNFPEIIILQGDGNLWWSGGINKGARDVLEKGTADYILLWNNDILIADDYFNHLDKLIPKLGKNIILGSKIYHHDQPDIIWSYGGIFNPKNGKRYMIGSGIRDNKQFEAPLKVDWLPGMGTLIPVEVINKIGYWDEINFPQYHGDSDYILRAKKAGFTIMVYPELKIWNDKSSSGMMHEGSINKLFKMLFNTRSNFEVKKNFHFYKKHSDSFFSYYPLLVLYFRLFGGFFKWKVLSFFGIKKN